MVEFGQVSINEHFTSSIIVVSAAELFADAITGGNFPICEIYMGRVKSYIPSNHFLLVMTFVHISSSPLFASVSGNGAIASIALSQNSCANARVCSSPSDDATMSRA